MGEERDRVGAHVERQDRHSLFDAGLAAGVERGAIADGVSLDGNRGQPALGETDREEARVGADVDGGPQVWEIVQDRLDREPSGQRALLAVGVVEAGPRKGLVVHQAERSQRSTTRERVEAEPNPVENIVDELPAQQALGSVEGSH